MTDFPTNERQTLEVARASDVVRARQLGHDLAQAMGFDRGAQTRIGTAISEITRNALRHSGKVGTLSLEPIVRGGRCGLRIVVSDAGCGIANLASVSQGAARSVMSLGAGLPGARRLMDEFEVETHAGQGTTVRMTQWLPPGSASLTGAVAAAATIG